MASYVYEVSAAICQILEMEDTCTIAAETNLETDLGFDSALFIELVMCLEDRVPGLTINPALLRPEDFLTVGTVAGMLAAHLQ